MDVHLVFSPVWSWPLVVLAAVGLYGLVLWTYPPRIRAFSPGKRRLLLGLRLLGATVLLFAMLRPALEFSEIDERGAQFVILTDQSRSMNTPDGPAGATRRQQLLKTLEEITPSLKALGEKVDIRYIEFAETSQAVETGLIAHRRGIAASWTRIRTSTGLEVGQPFEGAAFEHLSH